MTENYSQIMLYECIFSYTRWETTRITKWIGINHEIGYGEL